MLKGTSLQQSCLAIFWAVAETYSQLMRRQPLPKLAPLLMLLMLLRLVLLVLLLCQRTLLLLLSQ